MKTHHIENNLEIENKFEDSVLEDEYTPQLFSDVKSDTEENNHEVETQQNDRLFDQNQSDDDEFEIPAFLRKQKILMKISNNYNEITPYITGSKTSSSDAQ